MNERQSTKLRQTGQLWDMQLIEYCSLEHRRGRTWTRRA